MYAIVCDIVSIDAPFYTHINFCVWLVKRSTMEIPTFKKYHVAIKHVYSIT
jgi:hypothetical protein